MTLIAGTFRILARPVGPEGILLALLLLLGAVAPLAERVEPLLGLVAVAVAVAGLIIGWKFGRGRVVLALIVLGAATTLPLLPPGAGRSLLTLLIPVNLALIALFPDRGIATRGGMVGLGAMVIQGAAVILLVGAGSGPAGDPLARVTLPLAPTPIDATLVAFTVALAALILRAMIGGGAPARGLLWATGAMLALHLGHPGGPLFLTTAAGLVVVMAALEDAHSLAYRDALTGLPSRRALDELLDRTSRRYTVAMIDVDHFKQFNDRHGHDVGDQVLRMVATRLREVGGGARAFRYGGEEFTLVFRGSGLEEAKPFLEEARSAVEASTFVVRSPDRPRKKPKKKSLLPSLSRRRELSVTVSVGAAERVDRAQSPTEMLQKADAALYKAKNRGRNRVVA